MKYDIPRMMDELGLGTTFNNGNALQYAGLIEKWPVVVSLVGGNAAITFNVDRKPDKKELSAMKAELPAKTRLASGKQLAITVKKKLFLEDPAAMLLAVVRLLDKYGFQPKNECPYCGRGCCDTAAILHQKLAITYGLTHRACLQGRVETMQEKAETNAESGSYLTGFLGALLGMVVGCIPSVLTGLFADTIYAVLMALIPICSYFGYKLLGGKMNKVPLVLSIVFSVIGVYVMYSLLIIGFLRTEYALSLSEGASYYFMYLAEPGGFADVTKSCLTYFVFAALGILVSWRIISRSSDTDVSNAESELKLSSPWPPVAEAAESFETNLE